MIVANIVLKIVAEPLTAQAHGIIFLLISLNAVGNGMPITKPRGAIINADKMIFADEENVITNSIILGMKNA